MKSITFFSLFILFGFTTYSQSENEPVLADPQPPTYPGGETVMMQKLYSQITYPKYELDNNIDGVVYVSFFVEVDGTTSGFKITRGVTGGAGLDSVALHACKGLGNFIPGEDLNGNPQKTALTIPVKFSLGDDSEQSLTDDVIRDHAQTICQLLKAVDEAEANKDKKAQRQAQKAYDNYMLNIEVWYGNDSNAFNKLTSEVNKCL